MSLVPSAQHARRRHGEWYALAADVGGAISCFRATNSTVREMAATATTRTERPVSFRHAARRVPAGLSPSWTGRSAMSLATDSALSRLVTAGTRKSRVSEMRDAAARAAARPRRGVSGDAGAATAQRRRLSEHPLPGG